MSGVTTTVRGITPTNDISKGANFIGLFKSGGKFLIRSMRSEERRVGKECRSRWSPYH